MTPVGKVLWQGLAVIDAKGRAQLWNGGQTPKLYRSEEQGRYACTDGSTLDEVTILLGRINHALPVAPDAEPPVLAPRLHRTVQPNAPAAAPRRRRPARYRLKACGACHGKFTPTSGRQITCTRCR